MRRKSNSWIAAALIAAAGTTIQASSHREAPGITHTPKLDGTDFYMFRSYEPGRSEFVTLIANFVPLQAVYGGPNFFTLDPDAIYEIHVDNNGDAREDLTFPVPVPHHAHRAQRARPHALRAKHLPAEPAAPPGARQVSAFTIAHSITLALSIYGFVTVRSSIVEPLIAASIAYVAVENLFRSELKRRRIVLVFACGLLHGLGLPECWVNWDYRPGSSPRHWWHSIWEWNSDS